MDYTVSFTIKHTAEIAGSRNSNAPASPAPVNSATVTVCDVIAAQHQAQQLQIQMADEQGYETVPQFHN